MRRGEHPGLNYGRLWKESSAEQERRWYQNKRQFDAVHEAIMAQAKKHDRSIGALGSRWGTQSEATFRKANRLIVISPMIDPRAQQVADQLGIETFSDSLDVATL